MKQLKHDLVSKIETDKHNNNSMISDDLDSHKRETNKTISTMLRLPREFIKSSIDSKLDSSKSLEEIDVKYKQLYNSIYNEQAVNFTTQIDRVSTLRLLVYQQEDNSYFVAVKDTINELLYSFEVPDKTSLFIMLTQITRVSPEDILTVIKEVDTSKQEQYFVTDRPLSSEEIETLSMPN